MHMSPLLLSGVQCAQMSEQTQDHRSIRKVLTWNIYHCSQTVIAVEDLYLGCQGGCEDNYIG